MAALTLAGWIRPAPSAAHPADRLIQTLLVRLTPAGAEVSIAIGGGLLANERVLDTLNPDGDGTIDAAEARAWAIRFAADLRVSLDGQPVTLDPAALTLTVPRAEDFHLGLSPVIVAFRLPLTAGAAPAAHDLVIRNDYLVDRTDFRVNVQTAPGAIVSSPPLPARAARIDFRVDPSQIGTGGGRAAGNEKAAAWGRAGVIGRAQRALERPKTPALLASLIALFLVMGALHALQPGHGKTLVAAYLVATGGTARDALALAGIVTFTHTASVFALGGATLLASRVFLPSRVVPVLSVVSGLMVVAMGAAMLRSALRSVRRTRAAAPEHDQPLDHHHDHTHDHASLSDNEHARLHLAEMERALAPAPGVGGPRRVTLRSLLALGVSGGLAPCPDALAILLLAVGINQLALGMLAIVAFSLGLAGVLVAFGLAIALAGPFWQRAGQRVGLRVGLRVGPGALGAAGRGTGGVDLGRLVALSPAVSAAFVLVLGLGMVWRAGLPL